MSEWKELKTLQEVAAAQVAGEEVECAKAHVETQGWYAWDGVAWYKGQLYRSRPKKKVKTIVLREALFSCGGDRFWTSWVSCNYVEDGFVKWLDTPERIVEIEE